MVVYDPGRPVLVIYDKSGHMLYGGRLSYRDFEQILLSLGASGSDVQRLWPESKS